MEKKNSAEEVMVTFKSLQEGSGTEYATCIQESKVTDFLNTLVHNKKTSSKQFQLMKIKKTLITKKNNRELKEKLSHEYKDITACAALTIWNELVKK